MEETYFKVGHSDIAILLLWGDQDKVVPYDGSSRMVELLPRARFVPLSGFGHAVRRYAMPLTLNRDG